MRRIPTQQRREELVAAALRVIVRDGVAAATTRAVAAEAQMPLGAIHYSFGSHDDLLAAVVETVLEEKRFAAQVSSIEAASVEEAIRNGLNAYIDLLEARPEHELAVMELGLFARRQDPAGAMRRQWQSYFATAAGLLEHAAAQAGQRWTVPVDELGRTLICILDGLTTTWLADQDSAAARRTAAFFATACAAYAAPIPALERQSHAD